MDGGIWRTLLNPNEKYKEYGICALFSDHIY